MAPDFLERAAGLFPDSGMAYGMAKRGVIRAAARAAVRWGARGGRVNSVAPGIIDTPMGRQELDQQPFMHTMLEQVPLGRLGEADEVAFCGRRGSCFPTRLPSCPGIDVLVDGANGRAGRAGRRRSVTVREDHRPR